MADLEGPPLTSALDQLGFWVSQAGVETALGVAVALIPETLVPDGLSFLKKECRSCPALCVTLTDLGFLLAAPQIRKYTQNLLVLVAHSSVPVFLPLMVLVTIVMLATIAYPLPGAGYMLSIEFGHVVLVAKQWVIETVFSERGSEGQRGSGLSPSWKVAELGLELQFVDSKGHPLDPSASLSSCYSPFVSLVWPSTFFSSAAPKTVTCACALTEWCPLCHILRYPYCQRFW